MSSAVVFAEKLVGQEWRVAVPVTAPPPPLFLPYSSTTAICCSEPALCAHTRQLAVHSFRRRQPSTTPLAWSLYVAAAQHVVPATVGVCCLCVACVSLFADTFAQSVLFNLKTKQPSGAAGAVAFEVSRGAMEQLSKELASIEAAVLQASK
jgi:hypothetical protein